jgi:hypothetical protein
MTRSCIAYVMCLLLLLFQPLPLVGMEKSKKIKEKIKKILKKKKETSSSDLKIKIKIHTDPLPPTFADILTSEQKEEYKQCALQAEKYNQGVVIFPKELLRHIFSYVYPVFYIENSADLYECTRITPSRKLEEAIDFFVHLRTTCKNFYNLLTFEAIGALFKNCPKVTKSVLMDRFCKGQQTSDRAHIISLLHADIEDACDLKDLLSLCDDESIFKKAQSGLYIDIQKS